MALDHPADCGCAVCRRHRERLEHDQRFRETQADDTPRPEGEYVHREPATQEPDHVEHTTVVHEHHHHEKQVEQHQHRTTQKAAKQPRQRRPRRRHSVLRFLVVGAVLVWVLHSFYPGLDVPLVPGVACTSGTVQAAGFIAPRPDITPPPGTPGSQVPNPFPKLGDLAKDTVGHAAKKIALLAVSTGLHVVGATLRAMATHPPAVSDIRDGLHRDVETVGRMVGFVKAAFGGASPAALTDANVGTETVAAPSGCGSCPSRVLPAVSGHGIDLAARAVAATWPANLQQTALAVVGAESSYRPTVRNSVTASGLFQMKYPMHAALFHGKPWQDPVTNSAAAYELWRQQGWQPWVTYTSGAYQSHLAEASAALARVRGSVGGVVTAADVAPAACDTGGALPAATHTPGLQHVARVAEAEVRGAFGFKGTIGGYANRNIGSTNVLSKHALGLAIDVMVEQDRAMGNRIAAYFAGPGYGKFHVDNVIYYHRIYNAARGWHDYAVPPGGSPHYDHVHIDFNQG